MNCQIDKKICAFLMMLFTSILGDYCSLKESSSRSDCESSSCLFSPKTLFLPLSATQNLYTQYHKYHPHGIDFSVTYRYQEAYNNDDIIKSVLQYNPLLFVGSSIGDDSERPIQALVPEYFGFSGDTNSSLYLSPLIRNQILDIQLDWQAESVWFQVNIPLIKPQWKINKNKLVDNNFVVGLGPLQPEADSYIYNIGTQMNTVVEGGILPPAGQLSNGILPQGYNVLPPKKTIAVLADYNGAYIVSADNASNDDTFEGETLFPTSSLNSGATNFTASLRDAYFMGDNELSATNWKLDMGTWPTVEYQAAAYQAAYTLIDGVKKEPANITIINDIELSGDISNVADSVNGQAPNALYIVQKEINSASGIESALSGEYDFNGLLTRKYGNMNFNCNTATQSWELGDIILWLGYDISRCKKNHIGIYLHGVIPTGTLIDQQWNYYVFNPVAGNGGHYQLGVGGSAGYIFCEREAYSMKCNINGYVDHVFGANQFRLFDKMNQPMSRYAIVKKLEYTGGSDDNLWNDDYQFESLDFLGNQNNATMNISNNIKGEAIIDLIIESNCVSCGVGYAFSGMSADKISCNTASMNLPLDSSVQQNISYGYKGNTASTNLIVTNINTRQEVVTDATECPLENGAPACSYPLAYKFSSVFPSADKPALGNIIYVKSCGDVTVGGNSGAYLYGESVSMEDVTGQDYVGTTSEDVFGLPDIIGNSSGLLGAQICNKIFAHIDYVWDTLYKPMIGIVGSYSFGSNTYFTPLYWDCGFYIGCSF